MPEVSEVKEIEQFENTSDFNIESEIKSNDEKSIFIYKTCYKFNISLLTITSILLPFFSFYISISLAITTSLFVVTKIFFYNLTSDKKYDSKCQGYIIEWLLTMTLIETILVSSTSLTSNNMKYFWFYLIITLSDKVLIFGLTQFVILTDSPPKLSLRKLSQIFLYLFHCPTYFLLSDILINRIDSCRDIYQNCIFTLLIFTTHIIVSSVIHVIFSVRVNLMKPEEYVSNNINQSNSILFKLLFYWIIKNIDLFYLIVFKNLYSTSLTISYLIRFVNLNIILIVFPRIYERHQINRMILSVREYIKINVNEEVKVEIKS